MPKILIETASNQVQSIDSLSITSGLDQLVTLISQLGQQASGGLELDELSMSVRISAQGEVILLNGFETAGALTLKFKRSNSNQISYQKLEDQLKNSQWQAANQETWNLLCIILHKKQGTPLIAEDMEQIPCSVLNIIDKLWHKYSNGKFGFGVQSRIYKENQM
jgi:GUN4-like